MLHTQVEIAEESREALRLSRAAGADGTGQLLARTPALMAIPTWDSYTPMVVKGGEGDSAWVRTPEISRSDGGCVGIYR